MMHFFVGICFNSILKKQALVGPRIRSIDGSSFDYDGGIYNFSALSSVFEFSKEEQAP